MKLLIAFLAFAAVAPAQRIQWVRQSGTVAFEESNAVGYGEFGVYSAGHTNGSFAEPATNTTGNKDAFISLHDERGNLKWTRQFGSAGNAEDVATGVAGDGSGAYVVGYTRGAIGSQIGQFDSFIRKYGPDGDVLWTRQFGSVTSDYAYGVATHTSGVYVVGYIDCCAGSFPGMPQTLGTDGYIRKYSGDGTELWTRMISTLDIENAVAVAVDDSGVYVAGTTSGNLARPPANRDGFIRKYRHDGSVVWTQQFGFQASNGDNTTDDLHAIAAGPSGLFISGATARGVVPGGTFAGGLWDGYVARIDPSNGNPIWFRQVGTSGEDAVYSVAVGVNCVLIGGGVGANLVGGTFVGGEDAFFRLYDPDGAIIGTQQFGNGLNDSVRGIVSFPGGFFASGTKNGNALNLTPLGDNDVFVMKVVPPPFISSGGVLNGASFARGAVAPGSIAVVFGAYLNDGPQVLSPIVGADGKVATSLGGTQITVGGIAAPILYSTPNQVSIQIPYELTGAVAAVSPTVGGQSSEFRFLELASTGPGFFTLNQAGTGEAIALHQDGVTLIASQAPARRGEIVIFYLTGLGALNPALGTGVPAAANTATAPVTMTFGGVAATPAYAGAAPGFIGLNQINVQIPNNAPVARDVAVAISAGGRSGNPVTIAIGQ